MMYKSIINAKTELEEILEDNNKTTSDILCGRIYIDIGQNYKILKDSPSMCKFKKEMKEKEVEAKLKLNYTEDDLKEFLMKIDEEYYCGYGGQELLGMIWLKDGSWLERREYDGSEWWIYKKYPEIPEELK